jgi:type IV pilus assembly protein PilA
MLRKLRERIYSEEKGFTLIELLVVILIIGILAAIALPSFLSQRGKAQDSEAKSASRDAQTAIETFFTDNQTYVGATPAVLQGIEPSLNNANALATAGLAVNTYTVSVTSRSSDATVYSIARAAGGTVTRSCDDPGVNGCKDVGGVGRW